MYSLLLKVGQRLPAIRETATYILAVTGPARKRLIEYIIAEMKNLYQKRGMAKKLKGLLID
jgi:hypothetical protein